MLLLLKAAASWLLLAAPPALLAFFCLCAPQSVGACRRSAIRVLMDPSWICSNALQQGMLTLKIPGSCYCKWMQLRGLHHPLTSNIAVPYAASTSCGGRQPGTTAFCSLSMGVTETLWPTGRQACGSSALAVGCRRLEARVGG